jgi:hypothetical protein
MVRSERRALAAVTAALPKLTAQFLGPIIAAWDIRGMRRCRRINPVSVIADQRRQTDLTCGGL